MRALHKGGKLATSNSSAKQLARLVLLSRSTKELPRQRQKSKSYQFHLLIPGEMEKTNDPLLEQFKNILTRR